MLLKTAFPNARFSPPATAESIAGVETRLGITLPWQLRELYLECDGFRETRGNIEYLFSLTGSLVSTTEFWWNEWNKVAPPSMQSDFRPFVFFGSSSAGHSWGIRWRDGGEIIAYHHQMEDEYEVVGDNIVELYLRDQAILEQIELGT